jgi:acyl-CoA synthetase (AMP-forming)/AMP-acid ligase II
MSEFSYLCTPRTVPYEYKTIIQVFNEISTLFPDKEILIYRGLDDTRESLTCRQLQTKATKLAAYLLKNGIKKGDKIALSGPNSIEWVIAELGIIMAGGVVVHVQFITTDAREVYDIATAADCKAFFTDPGEQDEYLDMVIQLNSYIEENVVGAPLIFLRKSEALIKNDYVAGILQLKEEIHIEFPTLYPEDDFVIFTTSGSTGKPKMVPITHFQAVNNEIPWKGKSYNDRPFSWVAGSSMTSVYFGIPKVFCDSSVALEGVSTIKIWNIIKEEGCTSALLLPYFLADLVDHKDVYEDSFKLDSIVVAGQQVDNLHSQVLGIFTKTLLVAYGSTETLMVSAHPPITTSTEMRVGDVGIPIPGVEVKIIDEERNVLRKGENGELCMRSIFGFEKYYKSTEFTETVVMPGKWFRSGDIANINEDNHILIKGRIKDCISRGTRKIMPSSIEDVIITMKGIKNVVVVGVPDKRLFEEICVCYVTDPEQEISPNNVKEFCVEKFIEHDAIDGLGEMPKYFLLFRSLPKLGNGKIDKLQLRNTATQQLGLSDQMQSEFLLSSTATKN